MLMKLTAGSVLYEKVIENVEFAHVDWSSCQAQAVKELGYFLGHSKRPNRLDHIEKSRKVNLSFQYVIYVITLGQPD